MNSFCKIICEIFKLTLIILLILFSLGYLITEYDEPFNKLAHNEILVKNPQIISVIIFILMVVYSLYKACISLKNNESSTVNNYKKVQEVLDCTSITILKLSYLGRIVYTILSLEALFFFYNIVAQSLLLFPGPLSDMENIFFKILFYFLYFQFIIFSPIVLIIPTYEFISFPYLSYNDPYCHLKSFYYIYNYKEYNEEEYNRIDKKINKSLMNWGICFSIFFVIGIFTDIFSFIKDLIEFIIILFNFIHYMTLFFCYFLFSIIFSIQYMKKLFHGKDLFYGKYPEINILSYIKKQIDDFEFNICDKIIIYLKIIMIILSFIGFIYLFAIKILTFSWASIFFVFWFIILLELSFTLNFPVGYFGCTKNKGEKKGNSTKIIISLFISFLLSFAIILAYILINILVSDEENSGKKFHNIQLIKKNYLGNNISKTFHNFCKSNLYGIPIYLYQPFINDAYYYKRSNYSSFNFDNYTKLFFEDNYEIKVIDNLINENNKKKVKMIQYFIKNKRNNKNLTIFAIKGTSYKRDIFLDAQLYLPSILLNLLNTFSNLDQQKEAMSFKLIEYALSIPYRIFFQFSIIEEYIGDLKAAYYKYTNTSNINNENIVLVGHSLGGGLAKILGKIVGRQSISLSGPGINAFHSLWKSIGKSKFELTAIDIIPDLDIVPRVDISAGTIYRLLCLKSPIECHSKELSLCESLIICKNPYAHEYCKNITELSESDIKEIEKNSEFD